ncbi:hypothetical protein IKZ40_07440 [bacterium]|nr:hypothetical protein [bacterium]
MNRSALLTALLFLPLALPAFCDEYFTLDLPENWQKVPKESLDIYNRAEDSLKGQVRKGYSAAYERKGLLDFQMPYILVEQERHAPYSVPELEAMAEEMPAIIRRAYLPLHRAGRYGEVKVMPGLYDKERNMVFTYYEMTRAKPKEELFAFVACFPSRIGLIKLHGFGKKADYARSMEEMEKILQSFSFTSNYFYTPSLKKSSKLKALPVVCVCAFVILYALKFLGKRRSAGREPFAGGRD